MIKDGDLVLLLGKRRFIVRVSKELGRIGNGIADLSKILGKEYGDYVSFWGENFRIYPASNIDILNEMGRGAQVILPKDQAQIKYLCDIRPGDIVLEAGSGSGWMTASLAISVMPSGKVISYDMSERSIEIAKKNIEMAGLSRYVEFRKGDIRNADIGVKVSSCILDLPDPWNALENVKRFLIPGGHLCIYVPTYNQLEKAVIGMKEDFFDIESFETIMRKMDVKRGATRPEFMGLMHTGFIIHGRKK